MNLEKFKQLCEIHSLTPDDFYQGDFSDDFESLVGGIEEVENCGGEGEGDHCHVVICLVECDLYLRADGYYASDYGYDWTSSKWYEVRPIQKIITVYE